MPSTHTITTAPKPASGPGALPGFEARCTCGFSASTSLSDREARKLGFEHAAWAKRVDK